MEDSSETPLEKCQRLGLTIYSVTASEFATTATAIDVATAIADQKRISAPIDAGEESDPAHLVLDREPRDETTITDRDHLPISPPIRPTETCIPTNLKPDKEVGCEIIRSEESLTPAAHELQQPRVPASITDVTGSTGQASKKCDGFPRHKTPSSGSINRTATQVYPHHQVTCGFSQKRNDH